jgi:hypothetical protein
MTKKEQEALHSSKSKVEKRLYQNGKGVEERYVVGLSLTPRELLVLKNTLETASHTDEVRSDLAAYLNNALYRAEIKL